MPKINDAREFAKLYRTPIPVPAEVDYYLAQLQRSAQYSEVTGWIEMFADLECAVAAAKSTVAEHKSTESKRLISKLEATQAFARLRAQKPGDPAKKRDLRMQHVGQLYVSCDMRQANYATLKRYDDGVLPASWDAFAEANALHPALRASKSFRQNVFGHLEPKRTQRLQSARVAEVLAEHPDLQTRAVFVSHDEFVVHADGASVRDVLADLSERTMGTQLLADAFRFRPLRLDPVSDERSERGRFVQTHFDEAGEAMYRSLVGVPGNLFHLYFKRYILGEPLEARDLYFYNDHRLAQWVVDSTP